MECIIIDDLRHTVYSRHKSRSHTCIMLGLFFRRNTIIVMSPTLCTFTTYVHVLYVYMLMSYNENSWPQTRFKIGLYNY